MSDIKLYMLSQQALNSDVRPVSIIIHIHFFQCWFQALPFVGFAVAMFMFYSLVPVLLKVWIQTIAILNIFFKKLYLLLWLWNKMIVPKIK